MKTIAEFASEGFLAKAIEFDDGHVEVTADADIDADGANGQFGAQPAYMVNDRGSEFLANGGMAMRNGRVVGITDWFKDIVILDGGGQPRVFPGGIIASKTAYKFPGMSADDPKAYVDSETVPYIAIPPQLRSIPRGVVMGCRGEATNLRNGATSPFIVADIGPRKKVGEVSIELARRLKLPHSPRHGGIDGASIKYVFFPGHQLTLAAVQYPLIPMA